MGYSLLLGRRQLWHFGTVPNFVPTQARHSIEYGIFGRVNVSRRNSDCTVPSDPGQRPNITLRFTQARQKSVAQRVENEWSDGLPIVLGSLLRNSLECASVLLLEARRFDVAATCWRRPHPALFRLPSGLPAGF
jgi:hypothetical protein